MSETSTAPRPRQVTVGASVAGASCAFLVINLFEAMSAVRSTATRESVEGTLTKPPWDGLGVGVEDVLDFLHVVVLVSGALAAAGLVLAVYAFQRHRGARIGLTVTAALLMVTATFVSEILPLVVVGGVVLLWSRDARDWFAGRPLRPAAERTPGPPSRRGGPGGRGGPDAPSGPGGPTTVVFPTAEQLRSWAPPTPPAAPEASPPSQDGTADEPGSDEAPHQAGEGEDPARSASRSATPEEPWFFGAGSFTAAPPATPPYAGPGPSPYGGISAPWSPEPAGQPMQPGQPGQPGQPAAPTERPGVVTAAVVLTWAVVALTAVALAGALVAAMSDKAELFATVQGADPEGRLGSTPDEVLASVAVSLSLALLALLALCGLAAAAFHRRDWARITLVVAAVVWALAALVGSVALTPVLLVHVAAAVVVAVLLLLPVSNAWYATLARPSDDRHDDPDGGTGGGMGGGMGGGTARGTQGPALPPREPVPPGGTPKPPVW